MPKRLAAPEPAPPTAPEPKLVRRKSSRSFSPKIFWIAVAAIVAIVLAAFQVPKLLSGGKSAASAPAANATAPGSSAPGSSAPGSPALARLVAPPAGADTKTKLQAADAYTERKDYAMAEDIYKQVLKAEPNNVDAMKALASVLYREDKVEESAAVLDKLPRTN